MTVNCLQDYSVCDSVNYVQSKGKDSTPECGSVDILMSEGREVLNVLDPAY